jgi:FecR protein
MPTTQRTPWTAATAKLLVAALLVSPFTSWELSRPAQAADSAAVVASVVAIDGKLTLDRPGRGKYAAFVQMPDYVQDKLSTDERSLAAIELAVGGKIGINKSTSIQLTSATGAVDASTGQVLTISSGSVWAKFSKQRSTLQIKTPSATMGIRGTEFLVEATSEGTTIDVFEGAVAYAPRGKSGSEPLLTSAPVAKAGTRVFIKNALSAPVIKQYEVDQLRKEDAERNKALADALIALRMVNDIAGYLPGASGLREVTSNAAFALQTVKDPEQAAKDFAASQIESHMPSQLGLLGGMVRAAGSEQKKQPDFITDLKPGKGELVPLGTRFTWSPFKDAKQYVVLMSPKEDMKQADLHWAAQVNSNEVTYPTDGPPVTAGQTYYWRVVAMDGSGKPLGKASQNQFVVPASYKP